MNVKYFVKRLIFCYFIILTLLSYSAFAIIDKDQFKQIKTVSEILKSKCPKDPTPTTPGGCIIVGVGQSPTPFLAYLKAEQQVETKENGVRLVENYVFDIPLSRFRYGIGDPTAGNLDTSLQEKLFRHFRSYLPPLADLSGKSILLVDYVQSGGSLLSAQKYLTDFNNSEHLNFKVDHIGVISTDHHSRLKREILKYIQIPENKILADLLGDQFYDDSSPYGSFNILIDPIEKKNESPKFLSLKGTLTNMIWKEKTQSVINFETTFVDKSIIFHDLTPPPLSLQNYSTARIEDKLKFIYANATYQPVQEYLFLRLLNDSDSSVVKAALESIQGADVNGEIEKKIVDLIAHHENDEVRSQALQVFRALFRENHDAIDAMLIHVLNTNNSNQVRVEAIYALTDITPTRPPELNHRDKKNINALIDALNKSENGYVRVMAYHATLSIATKLHKERDLIGIMRPYAAMLGINTLPEEKIEELKKIFFASPERAQFPRMH